MGWPRGQEAAPGDVGASLFIGRYAHILERGVLHSNGVKENSFRKSLGCKEIL